LWSNRDEPIGRTALLRNPGLTAKRRTVSSAPRQTSRNGEDRAAMSIKNKAYIVGIYEHSERAWRDRQER